MFKLQNIDLIIKLIAMTLFLSLTIVEEEVSENIFYQPETLAEVVSEEVNISYELVTVVEYPDYKRIMKNNSKKPIPSFLQKVLTKGEKGIIEHYYQKVGDKTYYLYSKTIKEPVDEIIEVGNPGKFSGRLTGYGPDCVGCTGYTYCRPYPDVRNGKIYFNDKEYGKIRIVAADHNIPCGTIIEISNFKFSREPIIAIVLDRGGAITGSAIDLLYPSEEDTKIIGVQRNVNYKVLRWGW